MKPGQPLGDKDPNQFRSRSLSLQDTPQGLRLRSVGAELSFAELLQQRQRRGPIANWPIAPDERLALNHLGVSCLLCLHWQGRQLLLLVHQQRPDYGDTVAKLVSGYVETPWLNEPETVARREFAEELLWYQRGSLLAPKTQRRIDAATGRWPRPYQSLCRYRSGLTLQPWRQPLLPLAQTPVWIGGQRQRACGWYLHANTASLQLIYSYRIDLDRHTDVTHLSLWHAEERWHDGRLQNRIETTPVWLLDLASCQRGRTEYFHLLDGQLRRARAPDLLSEVFTSPALPAPQRQLLRYNHCPSRQFRALRR